MTQDSLVNAVGGVHGAKASTPKAFGAYAR